MPFIAFLGCDGSGKSAVIEQVAARLEPAGIPVTRGHWRPVAFSLEDPGSAIQTADDPHGQAPRGTLSSILKLGWLWMNWWMGWWKCLRERSAVGVILFDRYHADLLVDPVRYRYGGPRFFARVASRWMPQPDQVFFLDAPPEVLLGRKQEVSREALEKSRDLYLRLCKTSDRFQVVDASQPLDAVTDMVLERISVLNRQADTVGRDFQR
jgi:thymidylate kinase